MSASSKTGLIALVFLVIGYQAALFLHRSAVLKILSNRDRPDTVFVIDRVLAEQILKEKEISDLGRDTFRFSSVGGGNAIAVTKETAHTPEIKSVRETYAPERRVETFRFNPNEIPVEGLVRLGFSRKQAAAIDNYRRKGGRFRRKSDFARSFVVSDSIYRRLEPYIDIPLVDLNAADSAGFDALPGIGGHYAYKEQLMDIRGFDRERFDGLSDLIEISSPRPYALWTLPEDSLELHPYIGIYAAHGIVLFRENNPREKWTVSALDAAGVLKPGMAEKLSRCLIAAP